MRGWDWREGDLIGRPYSWQWWRGWEICGWSLGEGEGGAGELGAVPGEGGGDDGIVVAGGGRAVAEAAVGQALEGVVGEFGEQDRIVEEGDIASFDSEGEGFDEWSFGFGAGIEAAHRQAIPDEGVDIGFADGIGFSPDDLGTPFLGDLGEAVAL